MQAYKRTNRALIVIMILLAILTSASFAIIQGDAVHKPPKPPISASMRPSARDLRRVQQAREINVFIVKPPRAVS
jgi:hypothetical protein